MASPLEILPRLPAAPSLAGYPGSKGASGVAQRIIRQMPPHQTYIEAFAGHAAVFRRKRAAASSILIDLSPMVCQVLRSWLAGGDAGGLCADVVHGDALQLLPAYPPARDPGTLVYADPPYLRSTRTRLLYDHELHTDAEHQRLLAMLKRLGCMVMVSGYGSALYDEALQGWRLVQIPAMTRGGKRIECLWCNFPEPTVLHDPRWVGKDFRERERINRRQKRWAAKFSGMHPRERQAIAAALAEADPAALKAALTAADGGAGDSSCHRRG